MVRDFVKLGLIGTGLAGLPLWTLWVLPAIAQVNTQVSDRPQTEESEAIRVTHRQTSAPHAVTNFNTAATTVAEWQAQIAQSLTQITNVRLETTETGLRVILETDAALPVPETRTIGNALIVDIANAALSKELQQANPAAGIALVSVTSLPGDRVRVAITGTDAPPTTQVSAEATSLTFAVATGTATGATSDEAIQVVVTGEQDGYAVPNSSVGTRTDARILDVPQSIQVIPRQVIEDQGAIDASEALRNAGGARGFSSPSFNDGFAVQRNLQQRDTGSDLTNIEQIEVLQGPASVLYGSGAVGGVINFTSKQPQPEPRYEIEATIGNYSFYRPSIDLTGPLNDARTILYRLTASYENSGLATEFAEKEEWSVFPTFSFQLGERTDLTVEGGYEYFSRNTSGRHAYTVGPVPNDLVDATLDVYYGAPDFNRLNYSNIYAGYRLEHQFSDDWALRNRFRATFEDFDLRGLAGGETLEADGRTLAGGPAFTNQYTTQDYTLQTEVTGEVQTGILEHDLLVGFELRRNIFRDRGINFSEEITPDIDVLNPDYDFPIPPVPESTSLGISINDTIGLYAQNLLSIGEKVTILLGGRFDWVFSRSEDGIADIVTDSNSADAFAPRVGIVYQPIEELALYANWSRSFEPQFGVDRQGNPFVPVTGEQFEVGVKTELFDDRLTATLAAYQITRQNDLVTDPLAPPDSGFQIQIGEQQSRGINFFVSGEPLPGLNLIANYSYTDTEVTVDPGQELALFFFGVRRHSGSLWAVYEIQEGDLEGLNFGAGVFIGSRFATLGSEDPSGDLPGFARVDALLAYRRDNWRIQLNVQNLFDTVIYEGVNSNTLEIGIPFTIRGTVSVTF